MYYLNLTDGYKPFEDPQNPGDNELQWNIDDNGKFSLESAIAADLPRIIITIRLINPDDLIKLACAVATIKEEMLEPSLVLFAPELNAYNEHLGNVAALVINSLDFDQVASHHLFRTNMQKAIPGSFNAKGTMDELVAEYFDNLKANNNISKVLVLDHEYNEVEIIANAKDVELIRAVRLESGEIIPTKAIEEEVGFITSEALKVDQINDLLLEIGVLNPFIIHFDHHTTDDVDGEGFIYTTISNPVHEDDGRIILLGVEEEENEVADPIVDFGEVHTEAIPEAEEGGGLWGAETPPVEAHRMEIMDMGDAIQAPE